MKVACITIDLECDYGYSYINTYEAFSDTSALESILNKYDIVPTVFITKGVLESSLPFVKTLEELGAEFELHIITHFPQQARINEIIETKEAYIRKFGSLPLGYRGPAYIITEQELKLLADEGFKFDSSIFPYRRQGFFDSSMMPTRPFFYEDIGLMEIPLAVMPKIRLPISMSYVQFLRPPIYRLLAGIFGLPEVIVFNLHLHDLFKSSSIKQLPCRWRMIYEWNYRVRPLKMFEDYIIYLKRRGYRFVSMKEIYELVQSGEIETDILSKEAWEKWKLRN